MSLDRPKVSKSARPRPLPHGCGSEGPRPLARGGGSQKTSRSRPGQPPVDEKSHETPAGESGGSDRLQKALAAAGLGSRRQCEELILAGRVEVDGQIVMELGAKVDPKTQRIRVDGEVLARYRPVYYVVNKPTGVVATSRDPAGRTRVIDLLPDTDNRVFTVGRLDMSSEGMILLTNDGDLANQLTHPRFGVEKTYLVTVAGALTVEEMNRLKKGVFLSEGFARVVRLQVRAQRSTSSIVEIVLNEGRNREIRRLLARVGHKVLKLKRIAIGDVKLGDLAPGEHRRLRPEEVRQLRQAVKVARDVRFTKRPFRRRRASAPAPNAEAKFVVAGRERRATASQRRPVKTAGAPTGKPGAVAGGRKRVRAGGRPTAPSTGARSISRTKVGGAAKAGGRAKVDGGARKRRQP